jgi:hypothetical protein
MAPFPDQVSKALCLVIPLGYELLFKSAQPSAGGNHPHAPSLPPCGIFTLEYWNERTETRLARLLSTLQARGRIVPPHLPAEFLERERTVIGRPNRPLDSLLPAR